MKRLFKISCGEHGKGTVIVKWQPEGNLLATAGQNGEACQRYFPLSPFLSLSAATHCLHRKGPLLQLPDRGTRHDLGCPTGWQIFLKGS